MSEGKLHRLTFSQSLAKFLCSLDPNYKIQRFKVTIGRELQPDEKSSTGVYILMSNKGYMLRGQVSRELSNLYRDGLSKHVVEASLEKIDD